MPCFWLPLLLPAVILAQSGTVQASGTASISVNPDQAQITVGVVTDGSTAQDAAHKNAAQTATVLAALKQALGAAGTVQTVSYSVYPRYSSSNTPSPTIVGYTSSNTLQATSYDLSIIGSLIDSANQAGANNVGGLTFGLQNPEPVKQQALTQAAKIGRAHADAIATGLNAKTGTVVSAQEVSTYSPIVNGTAGAATTTPIQTGQVSVSANVTVTVQLTQ
ncbi:MAG TPA: SIMPL domain-containing protein [Bryobacteraceae bacterium]|nr:SIMPL domain-containing protein [Bryobacteraceae bacterium]